MKHAVCALALLVMALACSKGRTEERTDFFESKIRPVLVETCFRCHGGTKTSGGLRLDSREGLLKGGDSGPAIIPLKPMESLLIRVIRREAGIA
ncbi:MAG: c-type cytochrome domain-containing protein, partial [Gemmataceae bacterium]